MRVAIIEDSASNNHYLKYLKDFAHGIQGDSARIVNSLHARKFDCAVIFGSHKMNKGRDSHKGKGKIIASGMPYVQIETQLIGRPITTSLHNEFRVGVNGFLWDNAKWGFEHIEKERAKKVFERNGYDVNIPWKTGGDYILVCMQKIGDASLRGLDMFKWTFDTVRELRKHTDKKILVRPHPLYRKGVAHKDLRFQLENMENVHWQVSDVQQNDFVPVQENLKKAYCVVTYTSGTGIDAVLNGVPSIACDSGSMVYEVSSKNIKDIINPYRSDKAKWANKIAHCQWSRDEFRSGECWEHIKKSLDV